MDAGKLGVEDCIFCRILISREQELVSELVNQTLLETEFFSVLPALGPLVSGHVMVISKEHQHNLQSMGSDAKADYENVIREIRDTYRATPYSLLEAEHGSSAGMRGPCIVHTHINVLPNMGQFVGVLDGEFPPLDPPETWAHPISHPYFYLRADGAVRWYSAIGAPSQELRRRLNQDPASDSWDWALNENLDLVRMTVEMWG